MAHKPLFIPQNRIQELMRQHGLSQDNIAKMCGVSQHAVSGWIRGKYSLPIYAAIILAEEFDCSIDYLVCKTDVNRKPKDNGNYARYYGK